MAWWPGNERIYNEHLSPKITYSLGRTILLQASLAVLHPGVTRADYKDEFTPSLFIRSRLQTQSKHWLSDTPARVVEGATTPKGGKRR